MIRGIQRNEDLQILADRDFSTKNLLIHIFRWTVVDDYRLCCALSGLENFSVEDDCQTIEVKPDLNMCDNLMPNSALRVALWVLGISALIGNIAVITWRIKQKGERGGKKTLSLMVGNLAVSDLLMGLYMLIIAVADLVFGEEYFFHAIEWRSSTWCKIAGVLSVLSSEASVFLVTLISVDCFFGIVFPLRALSLKVKSAAFVFFVLWSVAICVSVVPTVHLGADSNVYGLSDVCIGLPLTTKVSKRVVKPPTFDLKDQSSLGNYTPVYIPLPQGRQQSWTLSIVLFLGVNLFCFLVVFCCYLVIFICVKRTAFKINYFETKISYPSSSTPAIKYLFSYQSHKYGDHPGSVLALLS